MGDYSIEVKPVARKPSPSRRIESLEAAVAARDVGQVLENVAVLVAEKTNLKMLFKQARKKDADREALGLRVGQFLADTIVQDVAKVGGAGLRPIWDGIGETDFLGESFLYEGLQSVLRSTLSAKDGGGDPLEALLFSVLSSRTKHGTFDSALLQALGPTRLAEVIADVVTKRRLDVVVTGALVMAKENPPLEGYLALAAINRLAEIGSAGENAPLARLVTRLLTAREGESDRCRTSLGVLLYATNIDIFQRHGLEELQRGIELELFGPNTELARRELSQLVRLKVAFRQKVEETRSRLDQEYVTQLRERIRHEVDRASHHIHQRNEQERLSLLADFFRRVAEIEAAIPEETRGGAYSQSGIPRVVRHIRSMIENLYSSYGVKKVGQLAEVLPFDATVHEPIGGGPLPAGESVQVLRPGLVIASARGRPQVLIRKAEVKPLEV